MTQPPVDLGGSCNLNLLVHVDGGDRFVVRVYRPFVTPGRLADIQLARRALPGGRLLEVERFVEHDAVMDSWARLSAAGRRASAPGGRRKTSNVSPTWPTGLRTSSMQPSGSSVAASPTSSSTATSGDSNLLFHDGEVVLITDLDFLGQRPRTDDLSPRHPE